MSLKGERGVKNNTSIFNRTGWFHVNTSSNKNDLSFVYVEFELKFELSQSFILFIHAEILSVWADRAGVQH